MCEENKVFVRRWYEEAVNRLDTTLINQFCHPDILSHDTKGDQRGIEDGPKAAFELFKDGFPDLHIAIEDMVAQGDRVAIRWTATGTHTGELMGIPATGKKICVTGIDINRIAGGKIVEHWGNFDQMGMMQQLGVVPPPPGG